MPTVVTVGTRLPAQASHADPTIVTSEPIATGQAQDKDPDEGKNPAAVELGRLGGKKDGKARAARMTPEARDIWTWTAICADTKLVPSWLVGDRSGETAKRFICDLSGRLAHRIQLTSGHFFR